MGKTEKWNEEYGGIGEQVERSRGSLVEAVEGDTSLGIDAGGRDCLVERLTRGICTMNKGKALIGRHR